MSFSITVVGKVAAIKRKLDAESARLTGQSKTEFDAVKPAIEIILDQNVSPMSDDALRVDANGHASFDAAGTKTQGSCQVTIARLGQMAE